MLKKLVTFVAAIVFGLTIASSAYAGTTVSVRLQQPATQSNLTNLSLTFTALDTNNNPITVYCYKKGPFDGLFTQFYGPVTLSNGGNTDYCQVDGSVISQDGTYQFYVTATDGVNTVTSDTVSVTFNRQTPGAPTNYKKQKIDDCTYKISFHTANDGRTTRVDLYSSQNASFSVDSGTKVNSLSIGPDADGSITSGIGDCTKTYYFAIRAFDAYGNGSGVVGDSSTITNTTVVNPTTTPVQGAIPVAGANVSGEPTSAPAGADKEVLGTETKSGEKVSQTSFLLKNIPNKKLWVGGFVLVLIVLFVLYFFLRGKKSKRRSR